MQEKLLQLCRWLEPRIRPIGWHCAATGSALYGHPEDIAQPIEDLDVLLYRHNGYKQILWRPFDVLLHAGFRKIEDCTEYPEFENAFTSMNKEQNRRKVFRVNWGGVKIDFLCIDEVA